MSGITDPPQQGSPPPAPDPYALPQAYEPPADVRTARLPTAGRRAGLVLLINVAAIGTWLASRMARSRARWSGAA